MKRAMAAGVGLMLGLGMILGVTWGVVPARADNSYKQITLRGTGLASITWVGGLFSTGSYDTVDYSNPRAEQGRSMRGPLICWGINGSNVSFGLNTNANPFVSVFIQHAPTDTEALYRDFMVLNSLNSLTLGTGFVTPGTTLTSGSANNEVALAVQSGGAFGRYLRARFVRNGGSASGDFGVQYGVLCDLSGDSIIR